MRIFFRQHWAVGAGVILLAVVALGAQIASASPLTNPSGAPFVKLGVYQGVVGIIGSGQSMEIGNLGTDIGSTGDLYLRPGNLGQATSARIFSNAGKGALSLATGKICFNPGGSANLNAYTCFSSWATSGDTYWTSSGGALQLAVVTPQTDVLQIGTVFSSILSTTQQAIPRRAVDVYAASGASSPAFRTGGSLFSGYDGAFAITDDAGVPYNGHIDLRGKLIVDVDHGLTVRSGSYYPWTSGDRFQVAQNGTTTNYYLTSRSGIDADTFDTAAALPFPTDHDLYWKPITSGLGATRLCLNAQINAPNTGLCTGGAVAGTPCSSSAQCAGGTCTNMCKVVQAICPKADGTTKRCVNGSGVDIVPSTCSTSADCGANNYCVSGKLKFFGNDPTSCNFIESCSVACVGEILCDGSNTALCPSNFGTTARSDYGVELECGFRGTGPVYRTRVCDCRLSADTPYWQVTSGNGVAQLCTQNFE